MRATEIAWNGPMAGDGAAYLLQILKEHNKEASSPHTTDIYARLNSVCQSSGTGKSRAVQEIARQIVCIPICLALSETGMYNHNRSQISAERIQTNSISSR